MTAVKIPLLLFTLLCTPLLARAQESYGTIRATTKLRGDGSKSTTIVDPDKRTAEETIIGADGKLQRKITYLLGEGDLSIAAIFYDAKGALIYKTSYKRDGTGRVIEASFTSPDDRYLGKRRFLYGASGEAAPRVEDYDANDVLITRPQSAGQPATSSKKR